MAAVVVVIRSGGRAYARVHARMRGYRSRVSDKARTRHISRVRGVRACARISEAVARGREIAPSVGVPGGAVVGSCKGPTGVGAPARVAAAETTTEVRARG
jgi:hypothetical protein